MCSVARDVSFKISCLDHDPYYFGSSFSTSHFCRVLHVDEYNGQRHVRISFDRYATAGCANETSFLYLMSSSILQSLNGIQFAAHCISLGTKLHACHAGRL